MARYQEQEAMPIPLENLKNKEDWDEFFTREADISIEWCAVGQHFDLMLIDNLLWKLSDLAKSPEKRQPEKKRAEVRILVPGCGNSILSERLYDAGFVDIMNVDPSKVVIERMIRKNWRERPEMKWRYMDITCLQQFEKDSFDVVVDKGGLDVLMEGSFGPRLGNLYLSEVKRVVSHGGKYITITRASSHTIDLLLNKFRFGWRWSISPIARPEMHIFMLVMENDLPTRMNLFTAFIEYADKSPGFKASKIFKALQKEIKICDGYHYEKNIMYTLEDLRLGARGDISVLEPGRRITVILGEPGVSRFSYHGVLLDAMPDSGEFEHQYAVIIIPQVLKRDTNYTKEEGQWSVSSSSKAYRSLLVILDSSSTFLSLDEVETDLTPLVKQLAPALHGNPACTPIFRRYNGITRREIVYEVR